jgi:hypothetical protein
VITSEAYFYELADTASQTLRVFHKRKELVLHVERNPLSMFMRIFKVPMRFASDGTAQQGMLNVRVRTGDPFEVSVEDVLRGDA